MIPHLIERGITYGLLIYLAYNISKIIKLLFSRWRCK